MQALQRTAMVLFWPTIACLAAACDGKSAPTETAASGQEYSLTSSTNPTSGGGKFLLGGTAQLDEDPENPANDVIEINTIIPPGQCLATTLPPFQNCPSGTISRAVDVKIDQLDNMLEFKAWFYVGVGIGGKSCFGGSPRLQLAIDLNGDGNSDGNAFGYFGTPPNFTACPQNTWLYEDLTGGDGITGLGPLPSTGRTTPNEEVEWDLTQFFCPVGTLPPGPPSDPCIAPQAYVINWSAVEQLIGAFDNHLVCTVALVDDTYGVPVMSGIAYYDLFSAGTATWTDRSDIAGRGFAKGCGKPDDDDHMDDGDHDKDHDRDADDDRYDHDRRERWKS